MRRALLASVTFAFVTGPLLSGLAIPAAAATSKLAAKYAVKSKPETKDFGEMPKGPLQIVVSIAHQHVTLYSNGTRVAQGPVSTGVSGRPTPTGVFSIIQKDRFHHSNLYSNAPMPFMERITWSGVALHEGPLPGYPASHGCIRMTQDFAARLWLVTKLGVRVVVAHNDVVPVEFAHPFLFAPKAKPQEPPVAGNDPERRVQLLAPVRFAQATVAVTETADSSEANSAGGDGTVTPVASDPLRGSLEDHADPDTTATTPAASGSADNPPDAVAPPAVVQAPPTVADPPKPGSEVDDPAKATPFKLAPKTKAAEQPVKRTGTVAVFVSRKEKKLFVRQGFVPLFDMPVEIDHPEQPFGTHVFTALGFANDDGGMRWNLMSIPAAPRVLAPAKVGKKGQQPAAPIEVFAPQTAAQVLDRIQIPQEAKDRISEILTPGSSLIVADQGLGDETGQGTDFIVLTR